jgi:uncharacterized protein
MPSQAETLYHLQQIDLQIISHQKRLDELAQVLQDNKVVINAQKLAEAAQQTLKPQQTKLRDLESSMQATTQKIKTSEDLLYSGQVKNPKELQDLQSEIAAHRRRKQGLEDGLLEVMIAIEEVEAEIESKQNDLQAITAEWEAQHNDLLSEQNNLTISVEKLQPERQSAAEPVTPENMQLYNSMRKQKANRPVAAMRDNSCTACGIELTRAKAQEVQRATGLIKCRSCERILVAIR